jgi:DNA-binding MarR family transcriptional regulator
MSALNLEIILGVSRAHAAMSRRFDIELGAVHGIGLHDLHLLSALARAPDQRLRRIDLARHLGMTASGVTWMLRPVIKRGLVASVASEHDARVAFAVLTEAGRLLLTDALPLARRLAAKILEPHFGRDELVRFAEIIPRVG